MDRSFPRSPSDRSIAKGAKLVTGPCRNSRRDPVPIHEIQRSGARPEEMVLPQGIQGGMADAPPDSPIPICLSRQSRRGEPAGMVRTSVGQAAVSAEKRALSRRTEPGGLLESGPVAGHGHHEAIGGSCDWRRRSAPRPGAGHPRPACAGHRGAAGLAAEPVPMARQQRHLPATTPSLGGRAARRRSAAQGAPGHPRRCRGITSTGRWWRRRRSGSRSPSRSIHALAASATRAVAEARRRSPAKACRTARRLLRPISIVTPPIAEFPIGQGSIGNSANLEILADFAIEPCSGSETLLWEA